MLWCRVKQSWVSSLVLSSLSCVCDLGKLLNLSKPWFPHQYNENNTYTNRGCWEDYKRMYIKGSAGCLAEFKCSVRGDSFYQC